MTLNPDLMQYAAKLHQKKQTAINTIGSVSKSGQNTHHNYVYVKGEDVYHVVRNALEEAGLTADGY